MSRCDTCRTTQARATQHQGDLLLAARRAARNPSPRNLAAVERARAERDAWRQHLSSHLAECVEADQ